jgi:DNA repair protein SbcD/Mre11
MRLLHTSDWHLGASLHGKKRSEEARLFLQWLIDTIDRERIDLLLIPGDIFDSSAPGSLVQRMYYEFLGSITRTRCKSVIVTAGNHDSPSLLSAPKEILRFLNIHVIGTISGDISEQIIPVEDETGACSVIVCAVPFLREKDIRPAVPAGSGENPVSLLTQGIISHYARVAGIAIEKRDKIDPGIPIVATGHLFAAGCETRTGDGIRECYLGSSVLVGADAFPSCFSYVALGHLHVPQVVAKRGFIRYSGSPIPIGFSEADHEKKVMIVDMADTHTITVTECIVPRFQGLASLKGKKHEIEEEIRRLIWEGKETWIEVIVESSESPSSLQNWIAELTQNTRIEPLKTIRQQSAGSSLTPGDDGESLENVTEREVFRRRLDEEDLSEEERNELTLAFEEILVAYQQRDLMEAE